MLQRFLPGGPRPAPLAESERPTLDSLFRQHADSVHRLIARLLGPGARGDLRLTLKPGTYQLWCSLADHRARGMHAVLTVTR